MKWSNPSKETYKMYNLKRKGGESKNRVNSYVQGHKQSKGNFDIKWNKGSNDLRALHHQTNLLTCEKKCKNTLSPGRVTHSFNPGSLELEKRRSELFTETRTSELWW